jgi:hypothetical protein
VTIALDLRPSFESALRAFGVPATVTVPSEDPVTTRALWLPPVTEVYPTGQDYRGAASRRMLALPISDVPEVPRGTVIAAPEQRGGSIVNWTVDETLRIDPDHHRLVVLA